MLAIAFALMMAGMIHAAGTPEELALDAINALPPHDKWDGVELRGVADSLEVLLQRRAR